MIIHILLLSPPTTLNQKFLKSNCVLLEGRYVTVTGLVAGGTYGISLCGANNFDTQLTIYPQGEMPLLTTMTGVAHNLKFILLQWLAETTIY